MKIDLTKEEWLITQYALFKLRNMKYGEYVKSIVISDDEFKHIMNSLGKLGPMWVDHENRLD
jgi:hypothetical protein